MRRKSIVLPALAVVYLLAAGQAQTPTASGPNSDPVYQQLRNISLGGEAVSVKDFELKRDAATFHLQDREMQVATGRYMAHRCMHEAYSVFDVLGLVGNVYAGRVRFHDGDAELAPGISVHLIGGHTLGLQVVRVHTARGWIVLASDASHYYRNMEEARPFPIVADVGAMVEGWRRVRELAASPDHVIPGHDPQVLARFPAPAEGLRGVVARVDLAPVSRGS